MFLQSTDNRVQSTTTMRDYIRRKEASPFRGRLEGGLSTRTLLTRPLKAQSTTALRIDFKDLKTLKTLETL